jgi:DNA/RNA-binding domain of Phe-tRNA-synthetase-like protein
LDIMISQDLERFFPDLKVLVFSVKDVRVVRRNDELEEFKESVFRDVKQRYSLETIKDVPVFRAYRDFFWKIGIDPTKNRPAAEALIRRILAGKPLPSINTLVDAYDLASIKSEVALAAFDIYKLKDKLRMRFALKGETFLGIGMDKPMSLNGGEVVVSDSERLVALYPHRDADFSKVTEETNNVVMLVCGVPGISLEILLKARQVAVEYIARFCDGRIEAFSP